MFYETSNLFLKVSFELFLFYLLLTIKILPELYLNREKPALPLLIKGLVTVYSHVQDITRMKSFPLMLKILYSGSVYFG